MKKLVILMDMNVGFAKSGALYSSRTEAKIEPIAEFCRRMKHENEAKIVALTDTHDPTDHEFEVFPPHCLAGSTEPEIVPELLPYCDWIIPKFTTGGFFEVQEYLKTNPVFAWQDFAEIWVVGCCTDLCVLNFSVILQKYLETEYHFKRIDRVPQLIIPLDLIETYDAEGHDAEEINRFYRSQYPLHGIKVLE